MVRFLSVCFVFPVCSVSLLCAHSVLTVRFLFAHRAFAERPRCSGRVYLLCSNCVSVAFSLCGGCEFAVRLPRVYCPFIACSLRCGGVFTVRLLRVHRVFAMCLPLVCCVSAVWRLCVRCDLTASFLRAHSVVAACPLYALHRSRPNASRRPEAPSGFRRVHLRWPSLCLLRHYLRRHMFSKNQLRHEGAPEADAGAARMSLDCTL